jgi:homoserine O-acetyltransferase
MTVDYENFEAGNVKLQCGQTIRNCKLAFKTYGTLSPTKDNVIVYPTWYSGQHYENEWLIGPDKALDPAKHFVIIPNMLGNGLFLTEQYARADRGASLSGSYGV